MARMAMGSVVGKEPSSLGPLLRDRLTKGCISEMTGQHASTKATRDELASDSVSWTDTS